MAEFEHETVLLKETVDAVLPHDGGLYIDCTLGGGGHTARLLELSAPSGKVLAVDQDQSALDNARHRFEGFQARLTVVRANFRDVDAVAKDEGFVGIDGIVFDLGVSSPQFDVGERGFSYRHDGPLDMRMDTRQSLTARDIVNTFDEERLAQIIFEYGEERFSRRIAGRIVRERAQMPIETTNQLAEIVREAIPAANRRTGPHPARRTFQALRIAVNDELGAVEEAVSKAFELLKPGGRLAIITFHSLEDRIVKTAFADLARGCICPPDFPICQCGRTPRGKLVVRKPILPNAEEIERNARARSAKLRVIEHL